MTVRTAAVVVAAAFAGLLFAPVFGVAALLLPVGVPALVVLLVALACTRPAAADWRPVLTLLAGVFAVVETLLWRTTAAGLPTPATLRALTAGAGDSWRLVLESTWPARPDPELLLFVPLLVMLAAVFGVELLHRVRSPLPAVLPSLAVLALSQLYAVPAPALAALAALGYSAVVATLLFDGSWPRIVPAAATAVAAALLAVLLLPAGPARYSLARHQAAPLPDTGLTSPLDEIAGRLADPFQPVFRVGGATDVDRWPVLVLDGFDGVNWSPTDRFRRLGAALPPGPAVTVPAHERSATVKAEPGTGPWLPSQTWPARVEGIAPLVAEHQGTLLLSPAPAGPVTYQLHWWQPRVAADQLAEAPIDPYAIGGLGEVGTVPPAVEVLAPAAVHGDRPSFATALALQDWFRANYRIAIGRDLPTGHGWPQLADFLLTTKRGTSEQFAAAYVALARILGIPARLVVGYRMPPQADDDGFVTVHSGDALAWPEVAVRGVGWVPLDPTGGAAASGAATGNSLGGTAELARQAVPPTQDFPPPAAVTAGPGDRPGDGVSWPVLLAVPLVALAGVPVGVPLAWSLRSWRRRRRPGAAAVTGAWEEVRDRLRAYGVTVSAGMTLRDLGAAATTVTDAGTVTYIGRLAVIVDEALWSGSGARDRQVEQAWSLVRAVRRGLARTGRRRRLRALLDHRGLRRPR